MVLRRVLVMALLCGSVAQAGGAGPSRICGTAPVMDVAGVQKQLTAAEALWQKRGPQRYTVSSVTTARHGGVINIDIRVDGKISGYVNSTSPARAGRPAFTSSDDMNEKVYWYTVPGYFQQIYTYLDKARRTSPCGTLKAVFDQQDGHLTILQHDDLSVIDDEFRTVISPVIRLPK